MLALTIPASGTVLRGQDYKLLDPETHQEKGALHFGSGNTVEVDGRKYLVQKVEPEESITARKVRGWRFAFVSHPLASRAVDTAPRVAP